MPSELALFDLPPTQVAVSDIHYQEVLPISQISGDSPIEFHINGQNSQDYLDLKGTLLCVKVKVKHQWHSFKGSRENGSCKLVPTKFVFYDGSNPSEQRYYHLLLQSTPCHD